MQDNIFFKEEGDKWFLRNKEALLSTHFERDPISRLIILHSLSPKKVLEIGASNGFHLAEPQKVYKAKCVGVEPSKDAVSDGKKRYPKIKLIRGRITDIPLQETFDTVIVNYVLHWVSRESLYTAISEIDRMVEDGGYLLIGDFSPDYPSKRRYHHRKDASEVFTYKTDYPSLFLASGLYRMVSHVTFDHESHDLLPGVLSDNRGACTLLQKSLSEYYKLT